LMYAPSAALNKGEYIELRNITNADVPLYDPDHPANTWRLTNGVTFSFPAGSSIPANGYALVVNIDPAVFRTQYRVPVGVQIFGPFTGALDNAGERVTIARPDGVEADQSVPYVDVDMIDYNDTAPWPTSPDGSGPSLARLGGTGYGNDATNWAPEAVNGSPGRLNFDTTPPTVSDLTFDFTHNPQRVTVTFSEEITTIAAANLSVALRQQGQADVPVPFKLVSLVGNVATFEMTSGASLANGNYRITLLTAGITDLAGNALAAGRTLDTFVLSGDIDRDRVVGPSDFNLLATHFGQTGQTWATGDFDGDGIVGPSDFNILATAFGTTLIAPSGLTAEAPVSSVIASSPTPTTTGTPTAGGKTTTSTSKTRIVPRATTTTPVPTSNTAKAKATRSVSSSILKGG